MKLINGWQRVVLLSLSFWMQILGLLVLIVPEINYRLTGQDYDPYWAWCIGVGLLLAGIVGRLVQQSDGMWREWLRIAAVGLVVALLALLVSTNAHAAPATESDTLDIAVPFIAQEEGERLVAYLDIVGVPTICFGSTRGVHLGMKKTRAECRALLRSEVAEYRERLHRYFTPTTIHGRLPPKRDAAYTSLAFNVGVGGAGKSTAVRRLNNGNIAGGCQALTWWNKAGGRVIRGLVNRRKREFQLCMADL